MRVIGAQAAAAAAQAAAATKASVLRCAHAQPQGAFRVQTVQDRAELSRAEGQTLVLK